MLIGSRRPTLADAARPRHGTAAPFSDLYGLDRSPGALAGPSVEDRLRDGSDIFERTWLLLEAADRTEILAADARAEADRAADAARAYLFLADRLRLLASSVPDGD